jgi:hypothetical protein
MNHSLVMDIRVGMRFTELGLTTDQLLPLFKRKGYQFFDEGAVFIVIDRPTCRMINIIPTRNDILDLFDLPSNGE